MQEIPRTVLLLLMFLPMATVAAGVYFICRLAERAGRNDLKRVALVVGAISMVLMILFVAFMLFAGVLG